MDTGEVDSVRKINPAEEYIGNLMPWTKRSNTMPTLEVLTIDSFQCRRDNRKYASLRSPSKGKYTLETKTSPSLTKEQLNNNQILQQFSPHKRHSHDNIRLNRSGSARYHRPNSVDSALKRKNTNSTSSQDRITDDNIKNMNSKTTLRNSKKGERGNAPNFFIRYQDVLREEKITDTPPPITYSDSTKFTQINEVFEYLLNLHCSKPVTKTCKQLFYIRSRLSKTARRNESMCDGCFGCDKENMLLKKES